MTRRSRPSRSSGGRFAGSGTLRRVLTHQPKLLATVPVMASMVAERRRLDRGATPAERSLRALDARTSVTMGVLSFAGAAVVAPVDDWLTEKWFARRLVTLGPVAQFVAALVGWDLAYYVFHRAGHRSRILWAMHSQHHSSEQYNLSTALRQPVPEVAGLLFFPPLAFLGISPTAIRLSASFNLLYQYWFHTTLIDRLPPLAEYVLNTPSHHRAHHGSSPQYLDTNYGGVSILWDRVFGTFEPEAEPVRYGLTTNLPDLSVATAALLEYRNIARDVRRASTWAGRFGAVFMPPGWAEPPSAVGARKG